MRWQGFLWGSLAHQSGGQQLLDAERESQKLRADNAELSSKLTR